MSVIISVHKKVDTGRSGDFASSSSSSSSAAAGILLSHGQCGDDLRVGVVGVKGQRVTAAHLQRHGLTWSDRLEHVHHVVVGVAEDALVQHVHQNVT